MAIARYSMAGVVRNARVRNRSHGNAPRLKVTGNKTNAFAKQHRHTVKRMGLGIDFGVAERGHGSIPYGSCCA